MEEARSPCGVLNCLDALLTCQNAAICYLRCDLLQCPDRVALASFAGFAWKGLCECCMLLVLAAACS